MAAAQKGFDARFLIYMKGNMTFMCNACGLPIMFTLLLAYYPIETEGIRMRDTTRSALAVMAAIAGTGCTSGRATALFFAQMGWAGWLGALLAAATFGGLVGTVTRLAQRSGASGFAALCRRRLGRASCRAVGVLHGVLMALVATVSLLSAGKLGALTLPLRHGFLWGMALALLLAALVDANRRRAAPWLGMCLCVVGAAFYAALALDARPPRLPLRGEVVLTLEGNVPAAVILALCFAALNACVAADAAARFATSRVRPARLGLLCVALLGGLLLSACAALARGGAKLLAQALPTVLLAARWGLFGFWLCAGFGFLCNVATLAAALAALGGWLCPRRGC